jgi:hypothetical protein
MYSIRDPTRVVDLEGFETTTVFSPYYYTDIVHLQRTKHFEKSLVSHPLP